MRLLAALDGTTTGSARCGPHPTQGSFRAGQGSPRSLPHEWEALVPDDLDRGRTSILRPCEIRRSRNRGKYV